MNAHEPDELEVLAAVAAWASPYLIGDAPVLGSVDWVALDSDDPRRIAAAVRAGLAWWRCGEPLEDVEERARIALDVESAHAIAGAVRWGDLARRPTFAELTRRRDWNARRDGAKDFAGGPLPAWGHDRQGSAA